ncbi:MAG: galactosamine-6-phosphate isomerase [Bacteroidia bacterium]|nr:galactosamine-6-phosphate isomerase [Bacteroidia bacterium]
MTLHEYPDHLSLSQEACDHILRALDTKPDLLLCVATGHSPLETYRLLGEAYQANPSRFGRMRIIKLDEWGGVPMEDPQTCESFVQRYLLHPLHITPDRYITFESDPEDPAAECARVQALLDQAGPVDLCILGLGRNGHIGFNEPADTLQPHCHVAHLSEASMQHAMAAHMDRKPRYGLCLGMADILRAQEILLLVTGSGKEVPYQFLRTGRLSTQVPASFLWLHLGASALIDTASVRN